MPLPLGFRGAPLTIDSALILEWESQARPGPKWALGKPDGGKPDANCISNLSK